MVVCTHRKQKRAQLLFCFAGNPGHRTTMCESGVPKSTTAPNCIIITNHNKHRAPDPCLQISVIKKLGAAAPLCFIASPEKETRDFSCHRWRQKGSRSFQLGDRCHYYWWASDLGKDEYQQVTSKTTNQAQSCVLSRNQKLPSCCHLLSLKHQACCLSNILPRRSM